MDRRVGLGLAIAWVMGVAFMNIAAALDCLMALYAVSYTRISLLMSALFWTHALIQIPAGLLVDRLGLKSNLLFCLAAMTAGSMLPLADPSLEAALVGRIVTGVGTGLSFPTVFKMIALYAPRQKIGTYQAFFGGFFSLGCIAAYLLIPRLTSGGWMGVYLAPALGFFPLLAWALFLEVEGRPAAPTAAADLARVFRVRTAWAIGLYHSLSWGSVLVLGSWVPSLLAEVFGAGTAASYAWGGILVLLISGIGRLSGGVLLFRLPPIFIAHGSIAAMAALFGALYLIGKPAVILPLALTAAGFASINFGAFF